MRLSQCLAILALAVTACAAPVVWVPPAGMSSAQAVKERQTCTKDAERVFAGESMAAARGKDAQFSTPVFSEESFQKCMLGKGFTKKESQY
jgi:hypothetical protein